MDQLTNPEPPKTPERGSSAPRNPAAVYDCGEFGDSDGSGTSNRKDSMTTTHFKARLAELRATRSELQRQFDDVTAAGDDDATIWQQIEHIETDIKRVEASLAAAERHELASTDQKTLEARERAQAKWKAAQDKAMQIALKYEAAMDRAALLHGETLAAFEEAHRLQIGTTPAGSTLGAPAVIARIQERHRQTLERQKRRDPNGKPMSTESTIQSLAEFLGLKRSGPLGWFS